MKYFLSLLLINLSLYSFSQSIKETWDDIKFKNWTLKISELDSSDIYIKETQGRLDFINNKNISKSISYFVYRLEDIDSTFEKENLRRTILQSCLTYTSGENNFSNSYQDSNYYYLLKPCHNCHDDKKNDDCSILAKQLNIIFLEKK